MWAARVADGEGKGGEGIEGDAGGEAVRAARAARNTSKRYGEGSECEVQSVKCRNVLSEPCLY